MQVEIGKIYEGTVKRITEYGAFVDIHNSGGEHLMGMVHISEISRSYVNAIRDFVTEGQQVRVKVIGTNAQGKISLSMKQTEAASSGAEKPLRKERATRSDNQRSSRAEGAERRSGGKPNVYKPKEKTPSGELSFEDMLSRFKQNSEERMGDIKRNTERKNRSRWK